MTGQMNLLLEKKPFGLAENKDLPNVSVIWNWLMI
jgi:hypothetical protein